MEPNKIYILHDIGKTELTPEEAKEHLSDTELPHNMKKIIEGVGKMSRIDEIKEEAIKAIECDEETSPDYYYDMNMGNHLKTQVANVNYLLSRLEIAEKALEKLSIQMPGSRDNELVLHRERIADKALKQIRE